METQRYQLHIENLTIYLTKDAWPLACIITGGKLCLLFYHSRMRNSTRWLIPKTFGEIKPSLDGVPYLQDAAPLARIITDSKIILE